MSVDTPPSGSGTSTLGEHIQGLGLDGSSPLMRTVTQEITAIELALSRGATYRQIAAAIAAALASDINPKTLRECVYRVRKRRASLGAPTASAGGAARLPVAAAVAPVPPVAPAAPTPWPTACGPAVADAGDVLFATPATDPEVITRIRSSVPDLDLLTWKFQQNQRKAAKATQATQASPAHRAPFLPSGAPPAEHPPSQTGDLTP